ncbi:RNase adapter RapZ [Lutimaribacter marinistellae]|uniref:RNase adapter RapZ n=1 Tax=Lutimaribacter marinistellae TaxID=1820329 RepID=A0ABV7TFR0_9RHOB
MTSERQLVIVTGPSGAGRSSALHALEDLGFDVVDNLPLNLVETLVAQENCKWPLALGIHTRTRQFSPQALIETIDRLAARDRIDASLLYLDCTRDTLLRRYSETRRRHPMAESADPTEGVARELALLEPLRARADTLIDTSAMNVHDLRREVERWYAPDAGRDMSVAITSFSYKRGLPQGLDLVFDCRFLRNPHWELSLRPMDGRSSEVSEYVQNDRAYGAFFDKVRELLVFLLPAYRAEGKSHLSIGFGCSGGRHRSVALTEAMANALADTGQPVSIRHRELERRERV